MLNKENQPLVSIIIVNFNGIRWLKRLIDSLLNQTYPYIEIIIVDNNSSDQSVPFIYENYQDSRVKVIKCNKNLGFASGNNIGISESSGDYLLLLNSDTWVETFFIERIYSFFINNTYDIVAPVEREYECDVNSEIIRYLRTIDILGHPAIIKNTSLVEKEFYLNGCCLFFTKKLYYETLGLDDDFFMYFEETDWFWRLNLLKKTFTQIPYLYVYHDGVKGYGLKYKSFLWRNRNTLYMLLKNYSLTSLAFILPLYFLQNILELLFFFLILKPKIGFSYLQGWYFNLKYLGRTIEKRKWVQLNRKLSDREIFSKMYFGSSKILHLSKLIKLKIKKCL